MKGIFHFRGGLSRLIWTPLKLVPPGTNFSEIFGPTLKTGNAPTYATGQNFASEICSRVYIISSLGGAPNFSEGVHILQ